MNSHRELEVWKMAKDLAADIYQIVKKFPKEEQFGLTDQIKRSTTSISANIAEGAGRNSPKEFIHFLSVAGGSSSELDSFLVISYEANFLSKEEFEKLEEKNNRIQKMNRGLQKSIKSRYNLK